MNTLQADPSALNDNNNNNNNNNSTFILKERGFTKSYVAKYRLFTPHQ